MIDLQGKKGIVFGIANDKSMAYGCAKALCKAGAEIIVPYHKDKTKQYVEPLLQNLRVAKCMQCDASNEEELQAVFDQAKNIWKTLDFVIHSIAFANQKDLHGPVYQCSAEGFSQGMEISCHSFLSMAKLAAPLMKNGGVFLTMTYLGSNRVIKNYNMMGLIKAALESSMQYLAYELASKNIRVFAISPGPVQTRAASGIKDFDKLVYQAQERAPMKRLVTIEEVGNLAAFLASPLSSGMTGQVIFVDGGYHIMG